MARPATKKTATKKTPRKTVKSDVPVQTNDVLPGASDTPPETVAPKVRRAKKPRVTPKMAYQLIEEGGEAGAISEPFDSEAELFDDLALSAKTGGGQSVALFKEVKRGKMTTKVKIG